MTAADRYKFVIYVTEDDADTMVDGCSGFRKIGDEFDIIREMQKFCEDEYIYLFDRLIELLNDGNCSDSGEMLL